MENSLLAFFTNLIMQLPVLTIYMVGLFIAFGRYAQQPKTARRTIAALAILVLTTLVTTGVSAWLPNYLTGQGASVVTITRFLRWIYLATNLLHTLGIGLLLLAIFRGEQDT